MDVSGAIHVCSVSCTCSIISWVFQSSVLHGCYLLQFILRKDGRILVRNVRFA